MELYDSTNEYIKKVISLFKNHANFQEAYYMKRYMRNKFEFYGIKVPLRRKISAHLLKVGQRPDYRQVDTVVKKLWQLPERECQYFGLELLERYKKEFTEDCLTLLVYMITHKSWWDTVDGIAKNLAGEYFVRFPVGKKDIIENWIQSGNIWLQRTTLLHQLDYKKDTDIALLFDLIERLKGINEFFIQKAIGWALREYSKTEPEIIEKYIEGHALSKLSATEGMKVILRKRNA